MFMDDHFMLQNKASLELYQRVKDLPIYDFHCHLDPKEIYEDQPFDNIVDLWLGGDHYKWRLMRANGVTEDKITGQASNEAKFKAWAETVGQAIGNPLFHFTHLELSQVFGIQDHLNGKNWQDIYHKLNDYIEEQSLSPRKLIDQAKVDFIGTTDSPLDDLKWHQKLKDDPTFHVQVDPTFRPDQAFVSHPEFPDFLNKLEVATHSITSFADFSQALEARIKYFAQAGARASDLSLGQIVYEDPSQADLDALLDKARRQEDLTDLEVDQWQTGLLLELCRLYKKYGLVTQIHFGALRNNSSKFFDRVGPDAGFDSMGTQSKLAENLNAFLNELEARNDLPKMVWYNLNPAYNTVLANTLANFQANDQGIKSQLQFGAAWWFADSKTGILDQLEVLGNQGLLSNFVGMLTDSRSFLSYPRHDYFRRILSSYIGTWIDQEEIPADFDWAGAIVQDIAYKNAKNFFEKGED
ncbi:Uronate isomerase [Alloiococcus otitis]|uniref:Uronate isomerase n=1 Tax=Alloiococcus otitis ATCC 51267 TaxID=883081 RepID=K9ESJ9_9LACT|nr:glucuronate isomerase [Alloiococcus otitis]EKU93902.1 hypothetical protein HMPREF9698_00579 [Alloiococcus otitis ATCC 51267]SUU81713.1 Uronate isomerase [Alloiococcus otitis]